MPAWRLTQNGYGRNIVLAIGDDMVTTTKSHALTPCDSRDLDLDSLGIFEGTDKSSLGNDYLRTYEELLRPYQNLPIDLMEIGIFGGASLRMWSGWLPLARIVGVDISPHCRDLAGDRVVIEIGSQSDAAFLGELARKYRPSVIIDDGSHIASDIQVTFLALFPVLEAGGLYVIEDTYMHFGPTSAHHQGSAALSLWDYFSALALGKARQWLAPEAETPDLRNCFDQIDRVAFAKGMIVIHKRAAATQSGAAASAAVEIAAARGTAQSWFGAAGVLMARDGDVAAAEMLVRRAINADSRQPEYHRRMAELLARQDRTAEAAAAMGQAASLAPNDPYYWEQSARLLRAVGDLRGAAEAVRRGLALHDANPHAYRLLAEILEALGDAAGAAGAWERALTLAHGLPYAREWQAAAEAAESALRPSPPDAPANLPDIEHVYTSEARVLRESGDHPAADALLLQAMERFPDSRNPLTEYAWRAQVARDWPEAIARWATVRARFPDHAEAYVQPARALAEQWRYQDAEILLAEGMVRLPHAAEIAMEHGWLAYRQRNWPDATLRFSLLRDRWPDQPDAWLGAALTARDQSMQQEADRILALGMARLPDHPGLALDYALLPVFPIRAEDKNRPEALARMARVRERFPDYEPGYLHGIRLLREAGQPPAAEALAGEGAAVMPESLALALAFAEAALDRDDAATAASRYQDAAVRFPLSPDVAAGHARALARAGDGAAAEAVLATAMERFPDSAAPLAERADLAARRQDWPEAVRLWGEATTRFPETKDYSHRLYEARIRLMETDPAAESALVAQFAPAPKPDPDSIDSGVRDLAMQFESLGGRALGCEFGIFQRDCGAEPLGLLRWADMPYDGLVRVLENRFEGVGAPENTELFLTAVSGGRGEYCTRDRRGDMMFMRAFIYEDEMAFDAMYASACRRLTFLTRKFVEDLERGSKIFVYRLTDRALSAEELDRLHRAMRAYGKNTLLYVQLADASHPNGTVGQAAPGLLMGYMDRFKMSPSGQLSAAPATASWLAVCRAAYALWSVTV